MKTGWVTKRLGEVCEIINGKNQAEVADSSGAYPIYGSGGIMGRANSFRCPAGCTVIGRKGSINNPLYVAEPFWNVDTAYALSPKDVDAKYLFYFCRSFDFGTLNCGTTIPSLTTTIVKDVQMPLAPLAEQKRIVAKIDAAFEKIDRLKANAERNLANAKELFQSALDEAMRPKKGWVEKRLGEVCSKIGSGATPKGGRNSYRADGISLIRSMNVYDHAFKYDELAHINEVQAKLLENVTIEQDDVLINITGASVARCCVVPNDVLPARVNQHVSILRIANRKVLEPDFLCYSLITKECKVRLLGIGEAGSTRQALTKSALQSFTISMPMIIEQRQIVNRLDILVEKTKLLEQHYTRLIADCAEMRQSVLRDAFEGRL